MSHKATNWLASLSPDLIGASEFRVLFHLCDCHNPSQGCFPTQAYLMTMTGASNGTVNNALNSLEAKGLIKRHQEREAKSRRQKPTRYTLGFEMVKPQEPSPISGDGIDAPSGAANGLTRLQSAGDGAVSNSDAKPSPIQTQSRLQPTGEKPVKEPVNNLEQADLATFWANEIRKGSRVSPSAVSTRLASEMISRGLVEPATLKAMGIAC